ncbi:hypothetical protein [Rhizobium terrae]|uniref:hypothetical protein n=1 Tax=Rhizobium terrae TaxID=2171756 RepID=UPI000E3D7AB3|nr:hypothetical protein [Rhizobium terrae]
MRGAAETNLFKTLTRPSAAALFVAAAILAAGGDALALSELMPGTQVPAAPRKPLEKPVLEAFEGTTLPQPGPAINRPSAGAGQTQATPPGATADPSSKEAGGPLEIIRDLSKLPAPIKHMREQIVEAAASGDIERLRPLFGTGASQTNVMNNEFEDPIEALKNFSGDANGQEILAIILDILSTGAAHFDVGTPDEAYVWPYFTGKALGSLTPPERVDLLRIVTAGDLAGMEENGNYNFFRLGIGPDGKWKFFSGGD